MHMYVHRYNVVQRMICLSVHTCMMHVIPYEQNDPIFEVSMNQGTAEDAVEILHWLLFMPHILLQDREFVEVAMLAESW